MTLPISEVPIKLVLTNSNRHKSTEEVLQFCCKEEEAQDGGDISKTNLAHNPSTDDANTIAEELLGELLYIGIIIKHANKLHSKENTKNWLKQNANYLVYVDIVLVSDNGVEVSALAHKLHLQEENYFASEQRKVQRWVLGRRSCSPYKRRDSTDGVDECQGRKAQASYTPLGEIAWEVDQDRIFFPLDNHKHSCDNIEEILLVTNGHYQLEGVIYFLQIPLTIAQRYLNKELVVKVQLCESPKVDKGKSGNSFLNDKHVNDLKNIFDYPSLLLSNVQWSSTFTSGMALERERKKKKNGRDGRDDHVGDNDDDGDEDGSDDDDDDHRESNPFPHNGEDIRSFLPNVNIYSICKGINKLEEHLHSASYANRDFKKIILTKEIIVTKPLNIKCKIMEPYLYLEIENVTKQNRVHIHEFFSRSVNIDSSDNFPFSLLPEETYSLYLPLENFVQVLSKKNTQDKDRMRNSLRSSVHIGDASSGLQNNFHCIDSGASLYNSFFLSTEAGTSHQMSKRRSSDAHQWASQVADVTKRFKNRNPIPPHPFEDKYKRLSFHFQSDKSIITLSIKWSIEETADNFIWSQYCMEVEMPKPHIFTLEVSFVKEINSSSVLMAVFSFYNSHHEEIDILMEMKDESGALNNDATNSLISFNSLIQVGIIKPFQRKSVSVRMLAIMFGVHNVPFVKITNRVSDTVYYVDLGSILVTE
ncbi:conserved Plasmodium protein, unknown function [Plasmodium knowlesi strain H]|uniref:Uncharacterized protein n=3 Tax=Plasmodium knowlesi TaxID=5850 RepID=A0A5K1TZL0_PLAKH|nr:conserved Plasmodium protein, unknown function [Plasmodium knowlesi strain H]OTN64428.1 Uncharacterized protein PKNOH_S130212900 [Plasmodium knowlesi]CAA9989289.1 conserved Plasmodium protein, unknown function [Plasmodium knowlesi strain H]SBO26135.1 conserved Plasmodium protein, unknown function [Plasmodium knowlesi strain H]SBO26814.1 conserved Plasmodium protein, unknown function [Plasmodium knowlesi strain H]VVS78763.1 conserved Plasmodium protein, unknown function [Plasmodium knowlesi |eukprot:XP_002261635.1 hypothetical protein, conserved in Plasmodium species [Plasmodium knowlesi strain H]